jgi:hypothetical protein
MAVSELAAAVLLVVTGVVRAVGVAEGFFAAGAAFAAAVSASARLHAPAIVMRFMRRVIVMLLWPEP